MRSLVAEGQRVVGATPGKESSGPSSPPLKSSLTVDLAISLLPDGGRLVILYMEE